MVPATAQPLPPAPRRPGRVDHDDIDNAPQRRHHRVQPMAHRVRTGEGASTREGQHRHALVLREVGRQGRPVHVAGEPVEVLPAHPRLVLQPRDEVKATALGVGVHHDRGQATASGPHRDRDRHSRHAQAPAGSGHDDKLTHEAQARPRERPAPGPAPALWTVGQATR